MNIFPFKCLYPDLSLIKSTDAFFASVKEKFSEFRNNGFYIENNEEGFYIYEVHSPKGKFKGILVANDLEDVKNLKIKPHEKTLPSKEQNMIEFTLERKAQIKPLLVGYDPVVELTELLDKLSVKDPFFSFKLEGLQEQHTIWKINVKHEIESIQRIFRNQINHAYIADGHHRCSTTLLLNENKSLIQNIDKPLRMLTLFLPFGDLRIYDYNRIIKLKDDMSKVKLIVHLSNLANLKPMYHVVKPKNKFEFNLFIDGDWFQGKWKSIVLEQYADQHPILDITIFNNEMIKSILRYEDFEMDYFIEYVSGTTPINQFEHKVNRAVDSFGILLYPVSFEELKAIADQQKTFPPKTTWFEPRVVNGIITLEMK